MNPLMLNRRQAGALLGVAALPLAVRANTPRDTLVVAAAFDDIIIARSGRGVRDFAPAS